MTENEAKSYMENEVECIKRASHCDRDCLNCELVKEEEPLIESYKMAIQALEEIQQYRAIGTIEELKAIKSDGGFTDDLLNMGYTKGYRKAIDDCYMKSKTMMEELSYQSQGRRNGKTHRLYCVQALEFLRQVAKELKGVQNDKTD